VFVDDRAGPIAFRSSGNGPPVLFLHGLGGTRTAWDPQLEALADEFRCIAWDMPGYGESDPIEPLTWDTIADAVIRLIDALEIERAHVVGLSFGGQQALHLALRHPDRIDRLVLADTSARFGADGTDVDTWMRLRLDPLDAGSTPADMAAGVIDAITAPGFAGRERRPRSRVFRPMGCAPRCTAFRATMSPIGSATSMRRRWWSSENSTRRRRLPTPKRSSPAFHTAGCTSWREPVT
jgi:pimeloyl-ACP methyl ester carboxylesterase